MFCCTREEAHSGEIVTAVCLDQACAQQRQQLCCTRCLIEHHQNHSTTTLKQILPELLSVHHQNTKHTARSGSLLDFIVAEFGKNDKEGKPTTASNIQARIIELLADMKRQLDFNNEEISKMRTIFKELNKSSQQAIFRPSSSIKQFEDDMKSSTHKHVQLTASPSKVLANSPAPSPGQSGKESGPDRFWHSGKHAYINLGANMTSAIKVSPNAHRLAVMGSKCMSPVENEVRIHIDRSASTNIMIGFCHESLVRKKEFSNCYGIGNGTYLIGQNGGDAVTAIAFHHSMPMLNRKEVVGWNFFEGETILLGVNYEQEYLYFQREGAQPSPEFAMKWLPPQQSPQLTAQIAEGFRLIVLLQSEGDQVSILQV